MLSPVQGNLRLHRECEYLLRDEDDESILSCVTYVSEPPSCFLLDIPSEHLAKDDAFDTETGDWSKSYLGGGGIENADLVLYVTSQVCYLKMTIHNHT